MRAPFRALFLVGLCGVLLAACVGVPTHEEITAAFDAGLKQYDAGNYAAAYKTWKSIEDVDLAALRNVALMLRDGKGVAKDPKAAQAKMAEAAEAGLVTAQADLGAMLLKGEAGPPDVKAAVPWLALAAQAGHPVAAFQLAELYEHGRGVDRDIEKARKLYEVAAAAGMAGAKERLQALPPAPRNATSPANAPTGAPPPLELRH